MQALRTRPVVPACRAARLHVRAMAAASSVSAPGQRYFETDKRPVVLFDGVCNLCNGGVNTMLKYDKKGELRLAALQSEAGRELLQRVGRAPDDLSSIVLVAEDGSWIKSDAILRIGRMLNIPYYVLSSLALPLPRFLRDGVYDQVASNRYALFGKSDTLRMSDADQATRFL